MLLSGVISLNVVHKNLELCHFDRSLNSLLNICQSSCCSIGILYFKNFNRLVAHAASGVADLHYNLPELVGVGFGGNLCPYLTTVAPHRRHTFHNDIGKPESTHNFAFNKVSLCMTQGN